MMMDVNINDEPLNRIRAIALAEKLGEVISKGDEHGAYTIEEAALAVALTFEKSGYIKALMDTEGDGEET